MNFLRLALATALLAVAPLHAQLRIVDYNTSGARTGLQTILAAIGAENVNGIAKPLDIISLQEQSTNGSDTQAIVAMLNALYGEGKYAASTLYGASTGSGTQTVIYNTQAVLLVGEALVGTASAAGQPRQALRAEFRPVGYDDAADFYIYASHFKASSDTTSAARRNVEAAAIRTNADALGAGQSIIYSGDFNIYKSSEAMWTTLTASGNGQAFDPINRIGAWSNNASFLTALTQSPVTTARYGGQTTGGLDDRFDWQMVTSALMDDEGMSLLSGSYHTFGNDGSVALNDDITSGSVTSLQSRLPGYTTAQAGAVLTALGTASDHMPVVADYQVPAKMSVSLDPVPNRVLVGASASVQITVTNSAHVVVSAGADELDFTVSGRGAITAGGSGSVLALSAGSTQSATLDTSLVGSRTGELVVDSSSQAAANKHFSSTLDYFVLDHAAPAFSTSDATDALVLDFGTVSLDSTEPMLTFNIHNLISALGLTAGLDLDAVTVTGDEGQFVTTLGAFTDLAPGGSLTFTLGMPTEKTGNFSAIYELKFSDEDLPGATSDGSLWIHAQGTVAPIPEPGSAGLLMLGGFLLWRTFRLRRCEI